MDKLFAITPILKHFLRIIYFFIGVYLFVYYGLECSGAFILSGETRLYPLKEINNIQFFSIIKFLVGVYIVTNLLKVKADSFGQMLMEEDSKKEK